MKAPRLWTPFVAFFVLMAVSRSRISSVAFWDAQAPWQQAWLAHCPYHRDLIPLVVEETRPGWRVLDIGAGSGALALPLQQQGCDVTALEPSRGMRGLLRRSLEQHPSARLRIERRTLEAMPLAQLQGYHLILACNSLHVTSWGFSRALDKIFQAGPSHICVISETRFLPNTPWRQPPAYTLRWQQQRTVDSSVAYHSLEEVWSHFQHRWGRRPDGEEEIALTKELSFHGQHYWLHQQAHLTICWWSKRSGGEASHGMPQVFRHPASGHRPAGELTGC